jgi:plasmid stability protein
MGVMLQIRDVPEETHRTLKARAAFAGQSLTEYARNILEQAASRPSREELLGDARETKTIEIGESAEQALAHVRDDLA